MRERDHRLHIFRVALDQRREALLGGIRLLVVQIELREIGHRREKLRIDFLGGLEACAGTSHITLCQQHRATQIGRQRLVGLLLLKPLDRLERLIVLLGPQPLGDQGEVGLGRAGIQADRGLKFAETRFDLA